MAASSSVDLKLCSPVQDGYPIGDKAGLVADLHLRTVSTMDKLRETLRDEHSFLMQARRPSS